MKIKRVTGEVIEVAVDGDMTLEDLVETIHAKWDLPVNHQRIKFNGKALKKAGMRLVDYGITDDSEVYVTMNLHGGCAGACDICGCGGSCRCDII